MNIAGIRYEFGTALNPIPKVFQENWERSRPKWKQVHGTGFAEVTQTGQDCGEVDALYTQAPKTPIGVVTADCVPILLVHREARIIAAIHSGWRGTVGEITIRLWESLSKKFVQKPKDWSALIGPSIRGCCYEVGEEIITQFKELTKNYDVAAASNKLFPSSRHLDLAHTIHLQLEHIGFPEVSIVQECTHCQKDPENGGYKYYSYRRRNKNPENENQRQWSIIEIL